MRAYLCTVDQRDCAMRACVCLSPPPAGLCKTIQPDSVFLTDCSTRFSSNCLLLLQKELLKDHTLVGVTARMRVMSTEDTFEVSERSLAFDVDSRYGEETWSRRLTFWLSPAPAQAFEFVSGSVLGTAMYDILGSLAVLPGQWWIGPGGM